MTYTYPSSTNLFGSGSLTFWVKSDTTGSYRFQIGEASSAEQIFDFTINTANTWEQKHGASALFPMQIKIQSNISRSNSYKLLTQSISGLIRLKRPDQSTHLLHQLSPPRPYIPQALIRGVPISFNQVTNGQGSIVYQVWYDNAGVPTIIPDGNLPGNSAGFSTSPIMLNLSPVTYPTVYLVAQMSWPSGPTPQLLDWGIKLNKRSTVPTITSPTNGAVGVISTPTIQLSSTDNDGDYVRYKIQLATDNAFTLNLQTFDQTVSQTGWSGQNAQTNTAYNSGSTASYTVQTPLNANTTYYIRAYSIDQGGTVTWSGASSTTSFATNAVPSAPVIASPVNNATAVSILPAILLSATDVESDYLRYKIQLATDNAFTLNLQTFDQTVSQTGWSGKMHRRVPPITQAQPPYIRSQSALTSGTTYFIRAYAIDPGGSVLCPQHPQRYPLP